MSTSEATDNFTHDDGENLGANWTEAHTDHGDIEIVSNAAKAISVGTNPRVSIYYNTMPSSADQYVQFDIAGSSYVYSVMFARADEKTQSASDYYGVSLRQQNSDAYLGNYINGSITGYVQKTGLTEYVNGGVYKLSVETIDASTVRLIVTCDGDTLTSWDDTTATRITGNGYVGISAQTANQIFDDFDMGILRSATSTSTSTSTTSSTTTTSSSTSTTTTSTSSSTSTTTTSTSSSTSSSTTTTSTSSSTSSSTSTTTTLSPTGGIAFGEENPTDGEIATSWQTWVTTGEIVGDTDWGKLALDISELGYSLVYDYGNATERTYTLTENKYGTGQGGGQTLQIRGSASSFTADDEIVEWENYDTPINREWRYVQVRIGVYEIPGGGM